VIQNAGFGAIWAGRIGSLIVEKYLRDTLTAQRVKLATDIANTNLMPGYLVRLQFITDSGRAAQWASQTGDSTRWKKFLDPSLRRQLLDTIHKASAHISIPFGPRPQVRSIPADSMKISSLDSSKIGKSDGEGKPKKVRIKNAYDTTALKPKERPVELKDSSISQSP
jgi:hypothetical protein